MITLFFPEGGVVWKIPHLKFHFIQEVLMTEDAIFWVDSSIQVQRELPDNLAVAFGQSPVLLMAYSGHSNYAVTSPAMYSYLPTDRGQQKATFQYEANSMLIVNTQDAFESVLKWVGIVHTFQVLSQPLVNPKVSTYSPRL